nr:putative ribonuclease H-like domain-containing protein [Tanacetum cinerariifolium]
MQTKIHVDNESAICVVKNHVYHSKTKHIEIRHHFIIDSYEKRLIEMVKIHTEYNVADLLTKAFDVTRFQFLIASIGLKLKGYLINDGYADLVQHADKKELAIPRQTTTGKELSNLLMAGSLPKSTLPTLLRKIRLLKSKKDDELKKENAEKQKLEEQYEAEELKKNLEIVPDDEDDVFVNVAPLSSKSPTIMDYKIYKEGKNEHFQIIRENGNHQRYLAFSTMLKNFDREDLKILWKIVKDSFNKSQPKEFLDVFLWHNLKVMFEHSVEDSV